jgi:hypothetical protein
MTYRPLLWTFSHNYGISLLPWLVVDALCQTFPQISPINSSSQTRWAVVPRSLTIWTFSVCPSLYVHTSPNVVARRPWSWHKFSKLYEPLTFPRPCLAMCTHVIAFDQSLDITLLYRSFYNDTSANPWSGGAEKCTQSTQRSMFSWFSRPCLAMGSSVKVVNKYWSKVLVAFQLIGGIVFQAQARLGGDAEMWEKLGYSNSSSSRGRVR